MDKTANAVAIFDKNACLYQDKYMDVGMYGESLDIFCNSIGRENASILELACGPGNITKYLLEKRPDFRLLATDLAPQMLALARANNPTAAFQLMDCRDIGKLNDRYDGIVCGFCLPYLSEEEAVQLIKDAFQLLNEGGMLYLSTMEEDAHNQSGIQTASSGDRLYMYYHRGDQLLRALEENGLQVQYVQRQEFPADKGPVATDLLILARK